MSNNIFHGPLSNLEDFNTSEQEIEQLKVCEHDLLFVFILIKRAYNCHIVLCFTGIG